MTTQEAEADRVAESHAAIEALKVPEAPVDVAPRTIVDDGQEFEVAWTPGRNAPALTGGVSGLGSTLSSSGFAVTRARRAPAQ